MSKKVEASPDAELAVFVRNARARLGLSGTELGETVGRTRGNISHWEQGLHEPPYTILRKLSEMSGIPLPGINSDWPFKTITSEEFFKLDEWQRAGIEKHIAEFIASTNKPFTPESEIVRKSSNGG